MRIRYPRRRCSAPCMAEIVQWSGHLVVAEKTGVRFSVSADLSFLPFILANFRMPIFDPTTLLFRGKAVNSVQQSSVGCSGTVI